MDIIDSMLPREEIRVYPLEMATLSDNMIDFKVAVSDDGTFEILEWGISYYNHYMWHDPTLTVTRGKPDLFDLHRNRFEALFKDYKSHKQACEFYPEFVIKEAMDRVGAEVAEDPVDESDDPTEDYSNDPEYYQDYRNG